MKPPCIKKKCLLYPTCRFKTFVECSPLHEYYLDLIPNNTETKEAWRIIQKTLPKLTGIFRDKRGVQFQL